MQEIKSDKFRWLDIQLPNADDILYVKQNFRLHPTVVEEFNIPTLRPKASEYKNCLYLAIHIPLFDSTTRTTYPGELDIVITEDALITSHDKEIWQLNEFIRTLREDDAKIQQYMNKTPGFLLYYIISMLLEGCFPKLDHVVKKLEHIEEEIFAGNEKSMVFEISITKRDVLNFRRTLKPQRSMLESLIQKEYRFIEPELKPYFQELIGTNIRVWNSLESAKETVESLEETNNSLLSNKLNLTMKVLTIFSAVMLPMTVYSNILAMSADIPFGKSPYGFWIHFGIMAVLAGITMTIFKVKKWI